MNGYSTKGTKGRIVELQRPCAAEEPDSFGEPCRRCGAGTCVHAICRSCGSCVNCEDEEVRMAC